MNWAIRLSCGLAIALAPVALWAQNTPIPPMLGSDGAVLNQQNTGAAPGAAEQNPFDRNRTNNINDAYGQYQQNGFPTTDVRAAVDADARAAFARMQYSRAQDDLNSAVRLEQMRFERSKDMSDALAAEAQAYDEYLSASQSALKPVQNDPKYQANAELKKELSAQIADTRGAMAADAQTAEDYHRTLPANFKPVPNDPAAISHGEVKSDLSREIVALSTVKLDYAQVIHDMESKVLQDDAGVQAARKKLMAAGQRVAELRDKFEMDVRTNPDMIALRRHLADARVANVVEATYRRSAFDAANAAIDYAYYVNRFNYYNAYPYNNNAIVQPLYGSTYGGYVGAR